MGIHETKTAVTYWVGHKLLVNEGPKGCLNIAVIILSGKDPNSTKIKLTFIRNGTIEGYLIRITLDWKTGRRTEMIQIGNILLKRSQT